MNGLPLSGFSDIVRIRFNNGFVCSGVFIDPFTVLTAAHCVIAPKDQNDFTVSFFESENDERLELSILKMIPHPNYKSQFWPASDVGIIKTSENKKFKAQFKLEDDLSLIGSQATLFGCGRVEAFKKEYFRTTGTNSFTEIGSVQIFLGVTQRRDSPTGKNVSIAHNDSGGIITNSETKRIIGVNTTTTIDQSMKLGVLTFSTGTSTVTRSNLRFIRSNLGPLK